MFYLQCDSAIAADQAITRLPTTPNSNYISRPFWWGYIRLYIIMWVLHVSLHTAIDRIGAILTYSITVSYSVTLCEAVIHREAYIRSTLRLSAGAGLLL